MADESERIRPLCAEVKRSCFHLHLHANSSRYPDHHLALSGRVEELIRQRLLKQLYNYTLKGLRHHRMKSSLAKAKIPFRSKENLK